MNLREKKEALKAANPDPKWIEKVDDMPATKIRSMYDRLKSQGKV